MLELKNLEKAYHSTIIFQKCTLQLEPGIYWIRGANGSGKTTFLKMVAGLLPFDGEISYNGINQKANPVAYRKCIGWAETEPVYPAFLSGFDLISLYQSIQKVPQPDIDKLLTSFGMMGYIGNSTGSYSAGMTKKLSLVLALMAKPPLCILDEPFVTLDADALQTVGSFIFDYNKNHGTTFLLSSHQNLNVASLTGKELFIANQQIFLSQ